MKMQRDFSELSSVEKPVENGQKPKIDVVSSFIEAERAKAVENLVRAYEKVGKPVISVEKGGKYNIVAVNGLRAYEEVLDGEMMIGGETVKRDETTAEQTSEQVSCTQVNGRGTSIVILRNTTQQEESYGRAA